MKPTFFPIGLLAIFFAILTPLILTSASPTFLEEPSLDPLSQLLPPDIHEDHLSTLQTTSLTPHHTTTTSLSKRIHERVHQAVRLLVMNNLFFYSLTNQHFYPNDPPSPQTVSLKRFYTTIRQSALNEWAKLPERSYVRIVCGKFLFLILPPADRTVPWSIVEDIAYWLLLLVTGSGFGVLRGGYAMAAGAAMYYYVSAIEPVSEEWAGQFALETNEEIRQGRHTPGRGGRVGRVGG